MSDKIKVEVVLDLTDLRRYTTFNDDGEPGYDEHPVSITEAVVAVASQQIVEKALTESVLDDLARRVTAIQDDLIRERATERIEKVLASGTQRTNDYGEPVGPVIPITDLIDREIKRQLQPGSQGAYGTRETVLQAVISTQVQRQLQADLQAAFNTARDAMLKAAQDAGAAALRAAVTKAVG